MSWPADWLDKSFNNRQTPSSTQTPNHDIKLSLSSTTQNRWSLFHEGVVPRKCVHQNMAENLQPKLCVSFKNPVISSGFHVTNQKIRSPFFWGGEGVLPLCRGYSWHILFFDDRAVNFLIRTAGGDLIRKHYHTKLIEKNLPPGGHHKGL